MKRGRRGGRWEGGVGGQGVKGGGIKDRRDRMRSRWGRDKEEMEGNEKDNKGRGGEE